MRDNAWSFGVVAEDTEPALTKPPHAPRAPRKFLGFNLSDLLAERRRAGISFAVGLIVLLLVQYPAVEQSFLGAPDREMMEMAFKLRADAIGGTADPVLFLDFDDSTLSKLGAATPFSPPLATVPRATLAELLDFVRTSPPGHGASVVMMDVDIAAPPSDGATGVEKLQASLAAWAADKAAAPLIISREAYPTSTVGMDGPGLVLPDTPYDAIVRPAPNIYWSEASVLSDQNGVVRDFTPYQCVITSSGLKPLYSAALIAYQFVETNQAVLAQAHAKHWMQDAASSCQTVNTPPLRRGELIDYHLSLELGFMRRVWPDLDPKWPGFATCDQSDRTVFRRLSAIDILDAIHGGGDISRGLLCRHVLIIGGTNASAGDFIQTPINEMNGSVVLANAVRGLQLTHGGLKPIPLIGQVLLLAVVSLAISASAAATSRARRRYIRLRTGPHKDKLAHRLAILPLNPLLLNGIIALAAHCFGVALLAISLNFGLWGFLSAPAFASAITETIQEFTDG
ncbi:MAG: CHASE2 domain-containing protein [Caulobacterales bacterium]